MAKTKFQISFFWANSIHHYCLQHTPLLLPIQQQILKSPTLLNTSSAFRRASLDIEVGSNIILFKIPLSRGTFSDSFSCESARNYIILLIIMLVSRKTPGTDNLVAFLRRDLNIRTGQKAGRYHPHNKETSSAHHDEQRIRSWVTKPNFLGVVLCVFGLLERTPPVKRHDLFRMSRHDERTKNVVEMGEPVCIRR